MKVIYFVSSTHFINSYFFQKWISYNVRTQPFCNTCIGLGFPSIQSGPVLGEHYVSTFLLKGIYFLCVGIRLFLPSLLNMTIKARLLIAFWFVSIWETVFSLLWKQGSFTTLDLENIYNVFRAKSFTVCFWFVSIITFYYCRLNIKAVWW